MRPIYPQPGFDEDDFRAVLFSGSYAFADCYTIIPRYGDTIRLTTCGTNISVVPIGGDDLVVYESRTNLGISGLRLKVGVGSEVDEQSLRIDCDQTAELFGLPLPKAVRYGRLDGSKIFRDRFIRSSWATSTPWVGGSPLFRGLMSQADSIASDGATLKVKSDLVLLNVNMPRDLYQPGCSHTLYDQGCGLNRDDFAVDGTVGATSTALVIKWAGALSTFTQGTLYIDNPQGVTMVRTIREATGTELRLVYPLEDVPSTTTPFTAYPGCARTRARCIEFDNEIHFKGFPYVPVAETAV